MNKAKEIAEKATMQSFLNCYLRETGNYEWMNAGEGDGKVLFIPLVRQNLVIHAPVNYWSLTGRHLFDFPMTYQTEGSEESHTLDYVTMTTLLVKEWLIGNGQEWAEDELILRVLLSCKKMKDYVAARFKDRHQLMDEDFTFIEAEQSLLFGHLLHPTPKSKQGLTDVEDHQYSPEYKGRFQLHYFSVNPDLIEEDSSLDRSASSIIFEGVKDTEGAEPLVKEWNQGRLLLPMHPLQVPVVLKDTEVQGHLASGEVRHLGPAGEWFTATSSFRTLYSESSRFMYKFSVPVKITNSLRANQPKELARGVEVSRLLDTELGEQMKNHYPNFHIMKDPASIDLLLRKETSGFEVSLRENPFYHDDEQVSLIAGLVQDHAYGGQSRLSAIIRGLAEKEGRTVEEVSLDWFDQYLSISMDPILWLHHTHGIALEAHQQNSVVRMEKGYPSKFYYRDNQGYYFSRSKADQLVEWLPSLNSKSDTICEDEVADERLRYYFFFNHLYGLINGFGVSRLVNEEKLIDLLRNRLMNHLPSSFVQTLLEESELPCKANLLTRLYDMDELVGPMEAQSVYTAVDNPLAAKVGVVHEH
ncbi:IucA/IucC family siderophore biosynthesis protein [Halobacillus litoralis]|uniref:IucA/IucC family siderophore biosynthesis protein n=1 Tax=Halobacillus litoralis TaxID=45668 RepID=A0A845E2J3_9BACI|nr:IucA/IucC family protein [Halobacillus litoralis]MYL49924.1 IucA/IucC family siderophore biosynthesis protein [Halobacillus litoralis]